MKLQRENSSKNSKRMESAYLVDQVEDFEAKLHAENMYLYKKFSLQNYIVKLKNQYPKIWSA